MDVIGLKLVEIAKTYLGAPYDTGLDGVDGTACFRKGQDGLYYPYEFPDRKYHVKSNLTGEEEIYDRAPLTCIDLVREVLLELRVPSYMEWIRTKNSWDNGFFIRRVRNFEPFVLSHPEDFDVSFSGAVYRLGDPELQGELQTRIGDIITTVDMETGYRRHIGIVSMVDKKGLPLQMVHSVGHMGVGLSPFFPNTSRFETDYKGGRRYFGFLGRDSRLEYVIRVKDR